MIRSRINWTQREYIAPQDMNNVGNDLMDLEEQLYDHIDDPILDHPDRSVINSKLADVPTATIKGRSEVGMGYVSDLTSLPNTVLETSTPTYTQSTGRANLTSGETVKTSFGKLMKWFADLTSGTNAWFTKNIPSGTVVGTTDTQTLTNKTIGTATPTEINYLTGTTSAIQTQLNARELKSNKGIANGYASLDGNTKVPTAQLPDFIIGQMLYAGTVNASTAVATLTTNAKSALGTTSATITLTNNTANITGYVANQGNYYIVSTDGTFAGIAYNVGDWMVATDAGWRKIDNTDAVTGVKGNAESTYRIGNINITPANVGAEPTITILPISKGGTGNATGLAAPTAHQHSATDITSGTMPPARIEQDTSNRFVTDIEKSEWNSKAPTPHSSTSTTYGLGNYSTYGHVRINGKGSQSQGTYSTNGHSSASSNNYLVARGYLFVTTPDDFAFNLDLYREVGEYTFNYNNLLAKNIPARNWLPTPNNRNNFVLNVKRFVGSTQMHQTMYINDTYEIWTRHTNADTLLWGDWIRIDGLLKANIDDVLLKTNTTAFTPTSDYHPATKKYVDSIVTLVTSGAVISVNGKTGAVNLIASDVNAMDAEMIIASVSSDTAIPGAIPDYTSVRILILTIWNKLLGLHNSKAPSFHSSKNYDYGIGTATEFGHVKLLGIGDTQDGSSTLPSAKNTMQEWKTYAKGCTWLRIPSAVNLNNYTEPGEYSFWLPRGDFATFPTDITWYDGNSMSNCILNVKSFDGSTNVHQTLYRSEYIWARHCAVGGAWQPWIRIDGGNKATSSYIHDTTRDGDVSRGIRWNNYGNGHVVTDIGSGTVFGVSNIPYTDSQYAWEPRYPVLVGWNGTNTFGARVDSARLSDAIKNRGGTENPSFESLKFRNGLSGSTTFASNSITRTIKVTSSGATLATRVTSFSSSTSCTITTTFIAQAFLLDGQSVQTRANTDTKTLTYSSMGW